MGVERRCECSELARTAYGACASDGRSADAWTERAPILRGREGVNTPRTADTDLHHAHPHLPTVESLPAPRALPPTRLAVGRPLRPAHPP